MSFPEILGLIFVGCILITIPGKIIINYWYKKKEEEGNDDTKRI